MNKRQEILAKALALPQLPPSAGKIMAMLGNPDVDALKLSRAIELDPGLTANVLRLANSSYFGGLGGASTIKDAVIRLGLNRVIQMAIAAGVAPRMKKEIRGYGLGPGELLEHSIAVGLASEELAKVAGVTAPPHVFTAGLLVNIGKTILGEYLEIDAEPILKKAYEDLITFERAEEAVLGISHTELGALALENWNIPQPIVLVARYRLNPEAYPGADLALDLVHVGDIVTKMTGLGMGVDGMHYAPSTVVFDRLGLKPGMLELVMEALVEQLVEVRQAFESFGD